MGSRANRAAGRVRMKKKLAEKPGVLGNSNFLIEGKIFTVTDRVQGLHAKRFFKESRGRGCRLFLCG